MNLGLNRGTVAWVESDMADQVRLEPDDSDEDVVIVTCEESGQLLPPNVSATAVEALDRSCGLSSSARPEPSANIRKVEFVTSMLFPLVEEALFEAHEQLVRETNHLPGVGSLQCLPCAECGESTSTHQCSECGALCSECVRAHIRLKCLRHHFLHPVSASHVSGSNGRVTKPSPAQLSLTLSESASAEVTSTQPFYQTHHLPVRSQQKDRWHWRWSESVPDEEQDEELEVEATVVAAKLRATEPAIAGAICGLLGRCKFSLGLYEEAIRYHKAQRDLAEVAGNTEELAASVANIGICCVAMGEHDKAKALLEPSSDELMDKSSSVIGSDDCFAKQGAQPCLESPTPPMGVESAHYPTGPQAIGNEEGPGQLHRPRSLAIGGGLVYVCDGNSDGKVRVFRASDGAFVRNIGGNVGSGEGVLDCPMAVALDHSRVYVSDYTSHRVQVYRASDGAFVESLGPGEELNNPTGLAVSQGAERKLYVADTGNHRVKVFDLKTDSRTPLLEDNKLCP